MPDHDIPSEASTEPSEAITEPTTATADAPADVPAEKTFTQAQVDSIVGQRLKEQKAEVAALTKALEEQKATAGLDAAEAAQFKAEQAEKELAAVRAEYAAARLEYAIKETAITSGVPTAKVPLVAKLVDRDGLLDDDGQPSTDAVAEAVAKVLDVAPEFVAGMPTASRGTGQPVGSGPSSASTGQPEPDSLAAALEQRYGQ